MSEINHIIVIQLKAKKMKGGHRMVGRLEVYTGGMFAEKSTNLQRQGKRHLLAGRKVIFLKPKLDDRYSEDEVVTHDGQKMKALNVEFWESRGHFGLDFGEVEDFTIWPEVQEADVVCIDEVQFFPNHIINMINTLIYAGKKVYVAGLDMDKTGTPFGPVPYLMATAEHVEKFQAVCSECGEDAWLSVEVNKKEGQVNVGNDYKPMCRNCADREVRIC
jgi:thymidine kinase